MQMSDKDKWRKQMAQSILDDAPFFPTTNDHIARALAAKQAPFQSSGEVGGHPRNLLGGRTANEILQAKRHTKCPVWARL
jgi:hypothetical protein